MATLAEGMLYKPTRSPHLRPDFDPSVDFVVVRPIKLNGILVAAEQSFPKQDVTRRLLRQLYEGGWLRMIPVIDNPDKVPRTRIRGARTMKSQNVSGVVSENKEEKTMTFQGRDVTIVRSVNHGDHGWDANKDQVVINDGGTEKTVL